MRVMLKFVVENQRTIARVAVADSGKTVTDAIFGEVLVTCEKLRWLANNGAAVLAPERRSPGSMVAFTKRVSVEFRPLGAAPGQETGDSDVPSPESEAFVLRGARPRFGTLKGAARSRAGENAREPTFAGAAPPPGVSLAAPPSVPWGDPRISGSGIF